MGAAHGEGAIVCAGAADGALRGAVERARAPLCGDAVDSVALQNFALHQDKGPAVGFLHTDPPGMLGSDRTERAWRVACTAGPAMSQLLGWDRPQAIVDWQQRWMQRLQPAVHRLHELASISWRFLEQNGPTARRLAGLPEHAAPRAQKLGSAVGLALGLLLALVSSGMDSYVAGICFVVGTALRFGFLFASFIPRGIAARLHVRFGMERGHAIYGLALDLLLFVQRSSFVALTIATWSEASGLLGHAIQTIGSILVLVGVGATLWAARVIGPDAYHYRDLFTGARDARMQDDGPYALCHDPMYTLGPLAGYGLAMLALSPMALLAAGVNQALLLAFNKIIELPRLWRSNWVFLETERREDLARSLLGIHSSPELAPLRAWDAPVQPVVRDDHHAAL